MKDLLKPGLTVEFKYVIPASKTVPYLYSEATEFQQMPQVLTTGFMVGLCGFYQSLYRLAP
jgi:fluoroacetyl-CoA thioesterase